MNPFPMLIADLRALRWSGVAIVALVALAVAVGVAISAQERALRKASAVAADDFDLLVGAPGSQTQLMLTSVFLQQDALVLVDGDVLKALAADRRVKALAPLAMGDVTNGYPIVGTTAPFVTRWGRIQVAEGRLFARRGEAVLGAAVALKLGETITPSHTMAGQRQPFGITLPDEAAHRHEGMRYTLTGRLPPLGTPWDNAILVPIEDVWAAHGLGSHDEVAHAGGKDSHDGEPLGTFLTNTEKPPGVPVIIVKPNSVADAYGVRGSYRQGGTMAFFPAEVLVSLYGTMGDMRDVLLVVSVLNTVLIFAAILLLLWAVAGLRRRRYAILRALGAPRSFILLLIWLNATLLLATGCVLGLATGWGFAALVSRHVGASTGLVTGFVFDSRDCVLAGGLVVVASLLSLIPALLSCNAPVIAGLKQDS